MTENPEPLEAMLAELKGERASVAATMTKEDVARTVDEWLAIARARAAGSSGSFPRSALLLLSGPSVAASRA